MLHESPVWIRALARLIVPRHVCDISDWFLHRITVDCSYTINYALSLFYCLCVFITDYIMHLNDKK